MTAIALSPDHEARMRDVARQIATAFRDAREQAHKTQAQVAKLLGVHRTVVADFEQLTWPNMRIGNVVRMLALFKLTIAVVPIGSPAAMHHVYDTRNLRIGN